MYSNTGSFTVYKIIVILFIFLLFGCGEKKNNPSSDIEMKFNIDKAKIGAAVSDSNYGLNFNPPVDWQKINDKQFTKAVKAINNAMAKEKEISVVPLYIFVKANSTCILNIAEVRIDSAAGDFNSKVSRYENLMMQNLDSTKVKKAVYIKDGIKIAQLLIQENNIVNFRLLFLNGTGKLIQFDYIAGIKDYSNEVKAIESSIGSIQITKI